MPHTQIGSQEQSNGDTPKNVPAKLRREISDGYTSADEPSTRKDKEVLAIGRTSSNHTKGMQLLRLMAKTPRESRVWGINEVKGAQFISTFDHYKRFDSRSLRKMCFFAEMRTFRKGQCLCVQGKKQKEVMMILGGTVSVRTKNVDEVKGIWSGDREVPAHIQTATFGNELYQLHAGDSIGFSTLLTQWGSWMVSCIANSKVEVLCFTEESCKPMAKQLTGAFDGETPVNILLSWMQLKSAPENHSLDTSIRQDAAPVDSAQMNETLPEELLQSLRGIPFLRQFESDTLENMISSMEVVDIQERQIMWDQDSYLAREFSGADQRKEHFLSSMVHVIMSGTAWVFRRSVSHLPDAHHTHKRGVGQDIQTLWDRPTDLLTAYGPCLAQLFPGDSFGGPFSQDHTLIVDEDSQLIRIRDYANAVDGSEGLSVVFQQETLRSYLQIPPTERTAPQKNQLLSILQQGVEFFRHVSSYHATKLLEQSTIRKFVRGDPIIKQGHEAESLFIIINGIANQYVTSSSDSHPPVGVWQTWEVLRHEENFSAVGKKSSRILRVGSSVGEQEVVENDCYRSTVIADDEVEVLEISNATYHTVLWDLCDGKAIPTNLIRSTLALPPQDRSKQDIEEMLSLLHASDFLSQFSKDMRRQMTRGMRVLECKQGSVLVEQGQTGQQLFLCISGSLALHKQDSKAGNVDPDGGAHAGSIHAKYGGCARVVGIGDSFGELAFVQGRTHPTTAFTRTECIMICIDREQLDSYTLQRIQSFVASPRTEVIDHVFAKPVEDRNENDVMLLVNYMEMNPFMNPISYPVMIDCAHTIQRQVGESGFFFGEEGEVNTRRVYIVNRGSVIAKSDKPESSLTVKFHEESTQTLLQRLHSYRVRYRETNDTYLYFGFMYQSSDMSSMSVAVKMTVMARLMRKVFAIDTNGDLTVTSSLEAGTLTELGHVSEIHTLERYALPKFPFAIKLGIRTDSFVLAANFRSECDSFIETVCLFHPYFEKRFASRRFLYSGPLSMLLSGDVSGATEWKMLQFKIDGDGEMSYSTGQDQDHEDWFPIGLSQDLLSCTPAKLPDRQWGMELVFSRGAGHSGPSQVYLAAMSKSERELWLDHLCVKCKKEALHARYNGDYGKETPHFDQAAFVLRNTLSNVIRRKRARKDRALQHLTRAASGGNRPSSPQDTTSFVGHGSAFSYSGVAIANEDCELFMITRAQWDAIKRRELGQQLDDIISLLSSVSSLELATRREVTTLAVSAYVSTHFAGEVIQCDSLSSKHVHVIKDGACTLRRINREKIVQRAKLRRMSQLTDGSARDLEAQAQQENKCFDCGGSGLRSGMVNPKSLSERVDLCPTCKGTGTGRPSLATPRVGFGRMAEGQSTDIATLRRPALLHESTAKGEELGMYELMTVNKLTIASLRKDQWDEILNKRSRAGLAAPEPQAGWLAEQQLANAEVVLQGIRRGELTHRQERRFAKELTLEQRAIMAGGKEHSKSGRSIKILLGGAALRKEPLADVQYVSNKREAKPQHCILAPPSTIPNPFARLQLPSAGSNRFPVPPLPVTAPDVQAALLDGLLSSARDQPPLYVAPKAPETPRAKHLQILHMLTPRREDPSDVRFHRPHRLKYGNQFDLDPRQQAIHSKISTLLDPNNFAHFGSIRICVDAAAGAGEATVNMFEFFTVLKKFDLLRSRMGDEAVNGLRAVSKNDAMKIFWKAVQEEDGGEIQGGARLGMSAFHCAVRSLCKLLQVPLDGKPDGRATVARNAWIQSGGQALLRSGRSRGKEGGKQWLSPVKGRDKLRDETEKVTRMETYALSYLAIRPS